MEICGKLWKCGKLGFCHVDILRIAENVEVKPENVRPRQNLPGGVVELVCSLDYS